jgi:spermidine synthase
VLKSRAWLWLYVMFLASGMSGLIYQVIWIRVFGNLFGNTVHSAALVTANFMLGLGLGAFVIGWWADRRNSNPVRLYGAMELVISGLALIVTLVLPSLETLAAATSAYSQNARGWFELTAFSYIIRYAVATALIAPIAFVMGGTLPVLIRHVLKSHLHDSAWRVGVLYGLNTLEAAVGALAVDFVLVPNLGLRASQLVAVSINLSVGFVALWISGKEKKSAPTSRPVPARDVVWPVFFSLFATGFLGMGLEILWFRFLVGVMGSFRYVFSLLLSTILAGIWLGSWAGGYATRRGYRSGVCFLLTQCGTVVSALLSLIVFMPQWRHSEGLKRLFIASPELLRPLIEFIYQSKVVLLVIGVPAFLMGFGYPLANALVQRVEDRIGRRAGGLYLANTLGGWLGALMTGFGLLVWLGMKNTSVLLAGISIGAMVILARHLGLLKRPAVVGAISLSAACAVLMLMLPKQFLNFKVFSQKEDQDGLLTLSEGINETLVVAETPSGRRTLLTNGHKMSATEIGDQRYMGAFVHIPLLQLEDPTSVLVICFGVGNTLHSASLHPSVRSLEIVDLSENILNHADYFKTWNQGILNDPRVRVFVNDGRLHLRMTDHDYDLITLEPPPIAHAGVSALYSREFYELARRRLKKGGYMTQWLPIDQVPPEIGLSMIRAFIDVFPDAVLLDGFHKSLVLMGRKDAPIELDPDQVEKAMAARPGVVRNMKEIALDNLLEIAGSFVATRDHLLEATARVQPLSDDRPLAEYSHRVLSEYSIPRDIFELDGFGRWCPKCRSTRPDLKDLETYLALMRVYYRRDKFLRYSTLAEVTGPPTRVQKSMGDVPGVLGRSKYLKQLFKSVH